MKRILIALLLFTVAAPAAAQDWARVFAETDALESDWQVLVMDPEAPRPSGRATCECRSRPSSWPHKTPAGCRRPCRIGSSRRIRS